ncbi:hypothetical protein M8J77_021611 [Diaphorina citri]|nr:hypothetical protein M8J77_021611 [Diaphorina citri]
MENKNGEEEKKEEGKIKKRAIRKKKIGGTEKGREKEKETTSRKMEKEERGVGGGEIWRKGERKEDRERRRKRRRRRRHENDNEEQSRGPEQKRVGNVWRERFARLHSTNFAHNSKFHQPQWLSGAVVGVVDFGSEDNSALLKSRTSRFGELWVTKLTEEDCGGGGGRNGGEQWRVRPRSKGSTSS